MSGTRVFVPRETAALSLGSDPAASGQVKERPRPTLQWEATVEWNREWAAPGVFGDDPAVQISLETTQPLDDVTVVRVEGVLQQAEIPHEAAYLHEGRVLVRFQNVEQQLKAVDLLREDLGPGYVVALTLAPRTPGWLRALGLRPMSLGLDLRGGVYFLYEVDMEAAINQALDRYESDFRSMLREERIRYASVRHDGRDVVMVLRSQEDMSAAEALVRDADPDLVVQTSATANEYQVRVRLSEYQIRQRQDFAIQQNTVTLRNRVNELGVAEPVVQRQGVDRIVVQLPGVQDPAQAERVLGATATLEFRLVDENNNPFEAKSRGRAPLGSKLYQRRDGTPVLLKRDIIVSGDQLTDASAGFSEGQPAVFVDLDAKGARKMGETTRQNLNKGMAVVFIETRSETRVIDGKRVTRKIPVEEVISVANILEPFGRRFQTTGLDSPGEAHDLALLLRAGALAAPIDIVEERTIGPSLGQDNIDQGFRSVVIGLILVMIFMVSSQSPVSKKRQPSSRRLPAEN